MPDLNRRLLIAAGAAGFALPAAAAPGVAAPGDMSLGNAAAPVKVVEYASLTCPHCAHFHATVFPTLKSKYIDTGRVHFTLKEFLTQPEQVAAAGFLVARCAGPSRYFSVVDGIFKSQSQWQAGNIKPILVGVAKANGLTEAQFDACLEDQKQLDALQGRMQRAVEVDKINATPSVFVNGKPVGGDHVPDLAELEAAIAAAQRTGRR